MYVMASFGWESHKQIEQLPEADIQALKEAIPNFDPKRQYSDWLFDDVAIRLVARLGLTLSFKEVKDAENLMWVKLQDRIDEIQGQLGRRIRDDDAEIYAYNAGAHIHVPDMTLLYFNEVMHLDDCCTDELRGWLDKGWRIIAVCPPNAKRRPDYILGRNSHEGAARDLSRHDLAGIETAIGRIEKALKPEPAPEPRPFAEFDDETPF